MQRRPECRINWLIEQCGENIRKSGKISIGIKNSCLLYIIIHNNRVTGTEFRVEVVVKNLFACCRNVIYLNARKRTRGSCLLQLPRCKQMVATIWTDIIKRKLVYTGTPVYNSRARFLQTVIWIIHFINLQ